MDYYKLGQRIREIRKFNNLSQEQLAEKVNISTTHMSHIETGNTKLSLPVFVDITKALGITTDELLNNSKLKRDDSINIIVSILNQCSDKEIEIITDIVKATKQSMQKNL